MHTGMLWFDNSLTPLAAKIERAAAYYQKKYGRAPQICLVHPSMLGDAQAPVIDGLTVRSYRPVLRGHIWIGREDQLEIENVNAGNKT